MAMQFVTVERPIKIGLSISQCLPKKTRAHAHEICLDLESGAAYGLPALRGSCVFVRLPHWGFGSGDSQQANITARNVGRQMIANHP